MPLPINSAHWPLHMCSYSFALANVLLPICRVPCPLPVYPRVYALVLGSFSTCPSAVALVSAPFTTCTCAVAYVLLPKCRWPCATAHLPRCPCPYAFACVTLSMCRCLYALTYQPFFCAIILLPEPVYRCPCVLVHVTLRMCPCPCSLPVRPCPCTISHITCILSYDMTLPMSSFPCAHTHNALPLRLCPCVFTHVPLPLCPYPFVFSHTTLLICPCLMRPFLCSLVQNAQVLNWSLKLKKNRSFKLKLKPWTIVESVIDSNWCFNLKHQAEELNSNALGPKPCWSKKLKPLIKNRWHKLKSNL